MDDRHHTHRNANDASDPTSRGAQGPDDDSSGEALLSAYLDGECTASEQAQIEERIAASPELRQLVDELRGVRTNLELLPQYRLEPDFAERVLRRAEQEVLVGGGKWTKDGEPSTAELAPVALSAVNTLPSDHERSGRARPFLWTLAALAAAVLILITNREPEIRRSPIASSSVKGRTTQAKKNATDVDKKGAKSDANSLRSVADDMLPQGEAQTEGDKARTVQPPASAPQPAAYDRRDDGWAAEPAAGGNARRAGEQTGLGALREKDNVVKDVGEETGASDLSTTESFNETNLGLKQSRSTTDVQREGFERAPTAQAPAEKRERDEGRLPIQTGAAPSTDKEVGPTEPTPPLTAGGAGASRGAAPESAAGVKSGIELQDETAQSNGAVAAKDDVAVSFATPQDSLRVVEVIIERDAWQRGAVDEILAKNQIVFYDSNAAAIAPEGPPATAAPSKPVDNNQEAKQAVNKPDPAATGDGLELLVVSATSAQVEAALGDFGKQDAFQVVNVTDASAPALLLGQSLQNQYNRLSKTAVRGGQRPAPTSEVMNDRLHAQDADNKRGAARTDEPLGQASRQLATKKLPSAILPDDKKPAATLSVEERIADESEKSRELRDAPARTRRIQVAPNVTTESRKEDAGAPAGALGGVVGRGLAQPDDANKSRAAGFGGYGYGGGRDGAASAGRPRYGASGVGGSGVGGSGVGGSGVGGSGVGGSGVGGGGYGATISADDGTTNVPMGYAQRVTIQQSAEFYRKQNVSRFQFGTSPDVRLQDEKLKTGALAPEQVLFLFRVVDRPVVNAGIEGAKSTSASSSPARRAGPQAAQQGGRANTPAPAPTAPGASAK